MTLQRETVEIDGIDNAHDVLAAMSSFASVGHGWINVQPEIPVDAPAPPRSVLSQFFRRNSPDVALATWIPSGSDAPAASQEIGLQHGLGTRMSPFFEDWGLSLGTSWVLRQDQPRRGLILTLPGEEDHQVVLGWILRATVAATRLPTTGVWDVTLYSGDRS